MAFPGPVPTPPNSGNPGTFNDDADAFLGWMALFAAWLDEEGYPDFHNTITTESGSASAPSHSFSDDDDTGMYRPAANQIGFATGGSRRLLVTSNAIQPETNLRGVDGNAGAPGISFSSDADTGILRPGSDQIGLATGGVQRLLLSSTALTASVPIHIQDGTEASPALVFGSDTDSGMYRIGADQIGFSAGGTKRLHLSTTAFLSTLPFRFPSASASAPGMTAEGDTDTGIYSPGADQVAIATGGTQRFTVGTGQILSTLPIRGANGSASSPEFSFSSDTNTGIYSAAADQIGFSTGGTQRLLLTTSALTSTLPIIAPAGSAASPSLRFSNDADTGFYSLGSDQLAFVTGGTRRATLGTGALHLAVPLIGDFILGTVGQSGGDSNGALFEKGSNANGQYTRFADGTQICTRFLDTSASADSTWTFPVAFSTALACVGAAFATGNITVVTGSMNATTCIINAYNFSGARVAAGTRLIAIGRWY